ncbi:MAG TPA: hypothetical protein VGQ96_04305 [Candidatus Eremiobacteraceae bacterium]|nr:hypothetical protein [Candidatus Eremiobacteraceae bacterium]
MSSSHHAQASAQAALNLRPLSLGEVLDRAFNIYFKNIAAFTALLSIVIVPSTLISYFQSRDMIDFMIKTFQHSIQSPGSPPDLSKINAFQPSDTWIGVQYALLFVGLPFAYGAVIAGVSRAYLGLPVHFAESYRLALRRWLPILMLIVLWLVTAAALFFAVFVLFVIGAAVIGLISGLVGNNTFFGISAIVIVIGSMLAGIGVVVMLYLTSAMSFIAVVIEEIDPLKAFSLAFQRMFAGGQFWRGFALALALIGINFGVSLISAGGGALLAYFLKAPALYVIAVGLTSLFFAPFAVVAAAVFYYDIRIRREGYDLQMLAERFSSATPPAASGL